MLKRPVFICGFAFYCITINNVNKELELWQFIASRLSDEAPVMLLVVAASSGSSPGRAGYKMAVAANGQLCGSIGGGVMEVNLVDQSRTELSEPGAIATGFGASRVIEQVHQKNSPNPSGMICSGRQSVILKKLTSADSDTVSLIVESLLQKTPITFEFSDLKFQIVESTSVRSRPHFSKTTETEFVYSEKLGTANELIIIGGGHCSLALSELMSKLDFRISVFDDRPELNTIRKNEFVDKITIIESYETIGDHIPNGDDIYVVVMTLGYKFDEIVIRSLIDHDLGYFGVLGSGAKMRTLLTALEKEGFDRKRLERIRTPIGIPINSHSPEEIAVSIAAEIISVKNKA